jgi:hypothetical protein
MEEDALSLPFSASLSIAILEEQCRRRETHQVDKKAVKERHPTQGKNEQSG